MKLRAVAASGAWVLLSIVLAIVFPIVSLTQGLDQPASSGAAPRVVVIVEAKHPWVDSGLVVRKGDRLSFEAEGTIHWGDKPDQVAGPEGHGGKAGKLGVGGLIGKIGYNGKPFPVGNTRTPIVMPKSGKLFLGINDFIFGDNAGSFAVRIARQGTL
jgi:hypothetical protein